MARDVDGQGGESERCWPFDGDCLNGGCVQCTADKYPRDMGHHDSDYAALIGRRLAGAQPEKVQNFGLEVKAEPLL